ncbi:MAG TPA: peptide-methionine (S)-S-oxide reductase MsrA [Gemmatimonadales bacterium]
MHFAVRRDMTQPTTDPTSRLETATLGGGCFWCTEAVMNDVRGVERVTSGYAGGHLPDPSYEQVCTGTTGHAEVVRVTFDPSVVSYRDLLRIFFATHDPTTPNRQGADVGPQYRSIVLTESDEQRRVAEEVIAELEREELWDAPVVTQVEPLTEFYPAEGYHDRYFERNPRQPYCQVVIAPKVAKFRKGFEGMLK